MKRVLLIGLCILSTAVICSAQTTQYFPQVANGVLGIPPAATVWKTSLFLTNPAASGTASGTITFMKANVDTPTGASTAFTEIAFIDQDGIGAGSGGVITFSIPPGQTRKYTSTAAGVYAGGFGMIVTTAGSVSGSAVFSNHDISGRLIAEAGVPVTTAVLNQAIFVDTINSFNVGVALANPGTASANITLTLLNSSAATVATTTTILGPGNHTAKFTSQLFTQTIPQLAGTMQVRSNTPLAALSLRFDPTFTIFTTLPPVTLASVINPAVQWLEQRPWLAPLTSVARLLGAFQVRLG